MGNIWSPDNPAEAGRTVMKTLTGLVLCLALSCAAAEPAAYKVERVVLSRSAAYSEGIGASRRLAQVEISAARRGGADTGLPSRDSLDSLTVVGTDGVANDASFYGFEKRCTYLCGDQGEECHYTALVSYDRAAVGTPLMVLAGVQGRATAFRKMQTVESDGRHSFSFSKQPLLWPSDTHLALELDGDVVRFTETHEAEPRYSYDARAPGCRQERYPDTELSRLACNGVEILLQDRRPLLLSYADYNLSKTRLLNSFEIGNRTYYTVLLGLKAYDAYGLLRRGETGLRFIVSPADWAMLC